MVICKPALFPVYFCLARTPFSLHDMEENCADAVIPTSSTSRAATGTANNISIPSLEERASQRRRHLRCRFCRSRGRRTKCLTNSPSCNTRCNLFGSIPFSFISGEVHRGPGLFQFPPLPVGTFPCCNFILDLITHIYTYIHTHIDFSKPEVILLVPVKVGDRFLGLICKLVLHNFSLSLFQELQRPFLNPLNLN